MKLKTRTKEFTLTNKNEIFEGTALANDPFKITLKEPSQKDFMKLASKYPNLMINIIKLDGSDETEVTDVKEIPAELNAAIGFDKNNEEDTEEAKEQAYKDLMNFNLSLLESCIISWENINDENGKELEPTKETLEMILENSVGFIEILISFLFNEIDSSKKKS